MSIIQRTLCTIIFLSSISIVAPAGTYWNFNTNGNFEGWGSAGDNHIANKNVSGGVLSFDIVGSDPFIYGPNINISTSLNQYIIIRMKTDFEGDTGQIYWSTDISPTFAEDKVNYFNISEKNFFVTYIINMAEKSTWSGNLRRFRIDPAGIFSSGHVEIDYIGVISISEHPPLAEIRLFSAETPLLYTVGEQHEINAKIKNTAPNTITTLDYELTLPSGIQLVGSNPIGQISNLAVGETRPLTWTVQCQERMFGEAKLVVRNGVEVLSEKKTTLFVSNNPPVNPSTSPAGGVEFLQQADALILQNESVRYVIQKESTPSVRYGPVFVDYRKGSEWKRISVCPVFSTLIYNGTTLTNQFRSLEPTSWSLMKDLPDLKTARFSGSFTDSESRSFNYVFDLSLTADDSLCNMTHSLVATHPYHLIRLDGPLFYAGNDPNLERSEGLFPGLEWLEAHEVSSSTAYVITQAAQRFVPHPYKITQPYMTQRFGDVLVAGFWDINQVWNQAGDKLPAAFYSTPDRYYDRAGSHIMGLFLPGFGSAFAEHRRESKFPLAVNANSPVQLSFSYWVKTPSNTSIDALDKYFEMEGIPEPDPYPKGNEQEEIKFSSKAFMDTLWIPDTLEWNATLGMILGHGKYDNNTGLLWKASHLVDDASLSEDYLQRAELVYNSTGAPRGGPWLSWIAGEGAGFTQWWRLQADQILESLNSEGLLVYDNDKRYSNLEAFDNFDYHTIGDDNVPEIGQTTPSIKQVLMYLIWSGDQDVLEKVRPTLEALKRFKVPRGAQVWEIPLGAPESLASSDAVQIYTWAYRLTGDPEYLDLARYWAKACLQFIYTWEVPHLPFMLYSSTPVYGATLFTGSWMGVPVQWLGLESAQAFLELSTVDNSYDWRKLARGITVSAMQQQRPEPEYLALYPDSWNLMNDTWSRFTLSPTNILSNLYDFMGYPRFRVEILNVGNEKIMLSSIAQINNATVTSSASGYQLSFNVKYPPKKRTNVMICGTSNPFQVTKNGFPMPRVTSSRYDSPEGYLFLDPSRMDIAIDFQTNDEVHLSVDFDTVMHRRFPNFLERNPAMFFFNRDNDFEYWRMEHHLSNYSVRNGTLRFRTTQADPYLSVDILHLPEVYPLILLRMSSTRGTSGQCFFATATENYFSESKMFYFSTNPNGVFNTYELPISQHIKWANESITQLRIDPDQVGNSNTQIDFVAAGTFSDRDGDGLLDSFENQKGLDHKNPEDALADPDNDGMNHLDESLNQTDPFKSDSDMDGFRDYDELCFLADPTDPASFPVPEGGNPVVYDFTDGTNHGWTYIGASQGGTAAISSFSNKGLGIQSNGIPSSGLWKSPSNLPLTPCFVYQVKAIVSGETSSPINSPTLRLLSGSEDGVLSNVMEVESDVVNNYSPTPVGREYCFTFEGISGFRNGYIGFELVNQNLSDDPAGSIYLESIEIQPYRSKDYDVALPLFRHRFLNTNEGWSFLGTPPSFSEPIHNLFFGGLQLKENNPNNSKGSWGCTQGNIILDGGHDYCGFFTLVTGSPTSETHPTVSVGVESATPTIRVMSTLQSIGTLSPLYATHPVQRRVFFHAPDLLNDRKQISLRYGINPRVDMFLSSRFVYLRKTEFFQMLTPTESRLKPIFGDLPPREEPTRINGWQAY